MAEMTTPICDTGWTAGDFDLPGIDGRNHRLADVRGAKGLPRKFEEDEE
jgi:hypothetical protein